jgi:hypothetical protein
MTKHEYQNPNQMTNDEASMADARFQHVTQSSSVSIRIKPQQDAAAARKMPALLLFEFRHSGFVIN